MCRSVAVHSSLLLAMLLLVSIAAGGGLPLQESPRPCPPALNDLHLSDPVHLSTQRFVHEQKDLEIDTAGGTLVFERSYRSFESLSSPGTAVAYRGLSRNWRHTFDWEIRRANDGDYEVHDPSGRHDRFDGFAVGRLECSINEVTRAYYKAPGRDEVFETVIARAPNPGGPPCVDDRFFFGDWRRIAVPVGVPPPAVELPMLTPGKARLIFPDGTEMWFGHVLVNGIEEHHGLRPVAIHEPSGRAVTIEYDCCGRLSRVVDGLAWLRFDYPSMQLPCAYNPDGWPQCSQSIIAVETSAGQRVEYTYYSAGEPNGSAGDLRTATLLGRLGDTPRRWEFRYVGDTGLSQSLLQKIIDPLGRTMIENEFLSTGARVSSQYRYGRDSRYDYAYELVTGGAGVSNPFVNTSVNRSGQLRLLEFRCLRPDYQVPVLFKFSEYDRTVPVISRPLCSGNLLHTDVEACATVASIRGPNAPAGTYRVTSHTYTDTEDPNFEGPDDEVRIRAIERPDGTKEERMYNYEREGARPAGIDNNAVAKRFWEAQLWKVTTTAIAVAGQPAVVAEDEYTYDQFSSAGGGAGCDCTGVAPTAHEDAEGRRTDYRYELGRLVRTERPGVLHEGTIVRPTEHLMWTSWGAIESRTHPQVGTSSPRVDRYSYDTPQGGIAPHPTKVRLNVTGAAPGQADAELQFEYDGMGNVIRAVDPRQGESRFAYNGFRELTMEETPTGPGGHRTSSWHSYDVMGNRVRTETENRGPDGLIVAANPIFTIIREFDNQNRLKRVCVEAAPTDVPPGVFTLAGVPDPTKFAVTEFEYNQEDQVTKISGPEVTSGLNPGGAIVMTYDEWNMLFRVQRGVGADLPFTQYDYTKQGDLTRVTESTAGASPTQRITEYTPDGLGRVPRISLPDGTRVDQVFDLVGNLKQRTITGGVESGAPATSLLTHEEYTYDPLHRLTDVRRRIFDYSAPPPQNPVEARVKIEYELNSLVRSVTDPLNSTTTFEYDGLHRLQTRRDALGNLAGFSYDPSGNLLSRITVERDPADPSHAASRTTMSTFQYDTLDRLIHARNFTAAGVSNDWLVDYDSRGNVVRTVDARQKVVHYAYDPLSRLVHTRRVLDGGSEIVTQQAFDIASRLIAQTDDNGNTTRYAYDDHGRLFATRLADGTIQQVGDGAVWPDGQARPTSAGSTGFDQLGNARTLTIGRPGGRVRVELTPDVMGRVTSRDVFLENSATVAAAERFTYDGLGRLQRAWARDHTLNTRSMIERRYDSLSRVLSEAIDFSPPDFPSFNPAIPTRVSYGYDLGDNTTRVAYPGGRVVDWARDQLGRVSGIWDLPPPPPGQQPTPRLVAGFSYHGPGRLVRQVNANHTATRWSHNGLLGPNLDNLLPSDPDAPPLGDLGFGRVTRVRHSSALPPQNPTNIPFDAWTLTWDRSNNKVTRTQAGDLAIGGAFAPATAQYAHDAVDRLISALVTIPGEDGPKDARWRDIETYSLDGVHNRVATAGGSSPGNYDLGATGSLTRQMNQYARSPLSVFAHDPRGNTKSESAHCRGDIAPPQPNGDIGDHRVNTVDMTRLLSQYGQPLTPNPGGNAECDINGDGAINTADLIPLLGNFGNGCDWTEYAYDWADRLVEVRQSSFENSSAANPPRVEVHRYEYDALGRRIARTLFAQGSVGVTAPPRCTRFIHGGVGTAADAAVGWQVLEEHDGAGATLATFVPSGRYVDEVVSFQRDLAKSGLFDNQGMIQEPVCGPPAPIVADVREYWLHRDDQFSTTSVTDTSGAVVERYDYHDYGFPLILDAAGTPRGSNAQGLYASHIGNPSLFTGREWDGESRLYHYRTRAYHPGLGRFLQIDRIGVWGDWDSSGAAYGYCASDPLAHFDPYGLDWWDDTKDGGKEIWEGLPNVWPRGQPPAPPPPLPPPPPPAKRAPNLVNPGDCSDVDDVYRTARGPRSPDDWANPSSHPGDQDAVDEWERELGKDFRRGGVEWVTGAVNFGSWFAPGGAFGRLAHLSVRGWTVVTSFGGTTILTKGGKVLQVVEGTAAAALTRSAQLVNRAKAQYPKLADKIQNHHIIPKYLGGDPSGPKVPLNGAYHQMITNAFRKAWPYGKDKPTPEQLRKILNDVYSESPLPP